MRGSLNILTFDIFSIPKKIFFFKLKKKKIIKEIRKKE